MSDDAAKDTTATEEEEKAKRKARGERYTQIMWTYVCGAITLLCNVVGLEASFIPLMFGALGSVLAWQLMQKGEKRHEGDEAQASSEPSVGLVCRGIPFRPRQEHDACKENDRGNA